MIQEWFKYLLVPEGLVQVAPVIQKAKAQKADNSANPPFELGDYTKIQRRFRKWANEPKSNLNQKPEWRQVVYLVLSTVSKHWVAPDSEGLELTWDCLKVRHRKGAASKWRTQGRSH